MDAHARRHHHAPVRVLTHIRKLDDCFGQFLVRVIWDCRVVAWRGGNRTMLRVQRTPSGAKLWEPAKHKELDYVYAGKKKRRSL
jgi:hypothetical protein